MAVLQYSTVVKSCGVRQNYAQQLKCIENEVLCFAQLYGKM